MFFLIKDEKVLEEYKLIWDKISKIITKEYHGKNHNRLLRQQRKRKNTQKRPEIVLDSVYR